MSKVLNKLKSNNGATLMLALLFFVVCAVTGSMILVSATVSSGRLENVKQRDQNYFAVRSAVKMIESQIKECVDGLTVEEQSEYENGEFKDYKIILKDGLGNNFNDCILYKLLMNPSISEKKDPEITDEDKFYSPWFNMTSEHSSKEFEIEIPDHDELKVSVEVALNGKGDLKVYVQNPNNPEVKDKYYMTLKMKIIYHNGSEESVITHPNPDTENETLSKSSSFEIDDIEIIKGKEIDE